MSAFDDSLSARFDVSAGLTGEAGASSVEYAILISLIAAIIVGIVAVLGIQIEGPFSDPELHDALRP